MKNNVFYVSAMKERGEIKKCGYDTLVLLVREEKQKEEADLLTGCSTAFGQCCKIEETGQSKSESSIWPVSVGH